MRFDGQLSARRRQEALEQFSIPLEVDDDLAVDVESSPLPHKRRTAIQTTLVEEDALLKDDDPNFIVDDADDDSDYEFEEGISSRAKKGKGKAKTQNKNKGKMKARLNSALEGVIPRVMLISLKAGALGLNLTVANNVFL